MCLMYADASLKQWSCSLTAKSQVLQGHRDGMMACTVGDGGWRALASVMEGDVGGGTRLKAREEASAVVIRLR